LFINKVDRLINELKLTPEGMQKRFAAIIQDFNLLIEQIAEEPFKEKFKVNVSDGSVAFGSARENWALSVPFMKKKNVSFKDIIDIYSKSEEERNDWVWKNAPLNEVILDMAVKHLPNPLEAQKYRIPKIWHGDSESKFGKDLINCNPDGEVAFVVTRIVIDPRSGKEVSAGRLYSGTLTSGMEVYCNNAKMKTKIQQVLVYNGIKPEQMDAVPAGNVLAVSGLNVDVGETVTTTEQTPFEEIKHLFEPVITKSIEVTKTSDLPKLIEILRKVAKEDPSIKVNINEQTGENLISGMGELHLEIIENRIRTEKGLEVKTSPPIVVYRETVTKAASHEVEGKSPNKHNSFFLKISPLEDDIYKAIQEGTISEGRVKKGKSNKEMLDAFLRLGWDNDQVKTIRDIYKGNLFLDETKGEVHIGEVIEMVLDAFEMVMDQGPLAREPCSKMKLSLCDIKLHEDAIHRGPAQVYPAVREGITEGMKASSASLLEPLQIHLIEMPSNFLGAVTKLVSSKRGQMINVSQEGANAEMDAKIPVAEMLGWSSDLRSATEGRGISSLKDQLFERIPASLQAEVIRKIRDRKGLAENQ
jgi:elongation factor 2